LAEPEQALKWQEAASPAGRGFAAGLVPAVSAVATPSAADAAGMRKNQRPA